MAKKKDITEDEPNVEKTKTSAEKRKPVEKPLHKPQKKFLRVGQRRILPVPT